jgi:hypothetical protein
VPEERVFEIELTDSARIHVETTGRMIERYVVMLLVLDGEWHTARV